MLKKSYLLEGFFRQSEAAFPLSCKVLLMLSWMGHGVALTLVFLKDLQLRGVTVAFIPM